MTKVDAGNSYDIKMRVRRCTAYIIKRIMSARSKLHQCNELMLNLTLGQGGLFGFITRDKGAKTWPE